MDVIHGSAEDALMMLSLTLEVSGGIQWRAKCIETSWSSQMFNIQFSFLLVKLYNYLFYLHFVYIKWTYWVAAHKKSYI